MIPGARPVLGGLSANSTEHLKETSLFLLSRKVLKVPHSKLPRKRNPLTLHFLPTSPSLQPLPVNVVHLAVLIGSAHTINSLSSYFEVVICPHWEVTEASTRSVMDGSDDSAAVRQFARTPSPGYLSPVFTVQWVIGISSHKPWNVLHPITFSWKLPQQSFPTSLPENTFARAIRQWHNLSVCKLRR